MSQNQAKTKLILFRKNSTVLDVVKFASFSLERQSHLCPVGFLRIITLSISTFDKVRYGAQNITIERICPNDSVGLLWDCVSNWCIDILCFAQNTFWNDFPGNKKLRCSSVLGYALKTYSWTKNFKLCSQNWTTSTNCQGFFRIGQLNIARDGSSLSKRCQLFDIYST